MPEIYMPDSEVIQSKRLEVGSAILIAGLSGLLTLAGVMSTSVIGAFSAKQSAELAAQSAKLSAGLTAQAAKIAAQQACVNRIDLQENNLRNKADQFLSAFGIYVSLLGHSQYMKDTSDSRLDDLLKAGFAFSAYAPANVATTTQNMVISLNRSLSEKDEKKVNEYTDKVNETYRKWNHEYQEGLQKLDLSREKCAS